MIRGDSQDHIKSIIAYGIVYLVISLSFLLPVSSVQAAQKRHQPQMQGARSVPQEVTLPLAEIASGVREITRQLPEKRGHPSWVVVLGPWFTGFAALLIAFALNFVVPWYKKPRLRVEFEKGKPEYTRDLLFDEICRFDDPQYDEPFILRQPGFNSRVKIVNRGRSVARNLQARLESIKWFDKSKGIMHEISYHPSAVKWSGEKEYNKIDIAPHGSFFFLDLVYSINETYPEIRNRYRDWDDVPWSMIVPERCSGDIYWAVWVDRNYSRGIPEKYGLEGDFELNYHLMADNSEPVNYPLVSNCISSQ
jgi:hypothetical protein